MSFTYTAFISYSSKNGAFASKLQQALEAFRLPKGLEIGEQHSLPATRGIGRLFRDRTDIPASPSVRSAVLDALQQSRALIVICSPEANSGNGWMDFEITHFRKTHPDGKILAVIERGNPPECFPSALLSPNDPLGADCPLAADFRKEGDSWRFGILKLVAGLLDLKQDDLVQRQMAAEKKRLRRTATALAVYGAVLSLAFAAALVLYRRTLQSRDRAIASQAQAANERGFHDKALLLSIAATPPRNGAIQNMDASAHAQLRRSLICNKLLSVHQAHYSKIMCLAKHPSKPWISTGDFGGSLKIFRLPEVANLSEAKIGDGVMIMATAFSADGSMLASASSGPRGAIVTTWNLGSDGMLTKRGETTLGPAKTGNIAYSINFSPDGTLLVAGCQDGLAYVIDSSQAKVLCTSAQHGSAVSNAMFSANGNRVFSCSIGGHQLQWNPHSGENFSEYPEDTTIMSMVPAPDDDGWITTDALSSRIRIWTLSGPGSYVHRTELKAGILIPSSKDPAGAVCTWDGDIEFFDSSSYVALASLKWDERISAGCFFNDDRNFVTVDWAGQICVWSSPLADINFSLPASGEGGPPSITSDGSSNCYVLRYGGMLSKVRQFGMDSSLLATTGFSGGKSLSISADGKCAAFVTGKGVAMIQELQQNSAPRPLGDVAGIADEVVFTGNDCVVKAQNKLTIVATDMTRGGSSNISLPKNVAPTIMRKSKFGSEVVIGGEDGKSYVLKDGRIAQIPGWSQDSVVMGADYNVQAQILATGGNNGRIYVGKIYDPKSRVTMVAGRERQPWVRELAISQDGSVVASGTTDGMVQLWDTSSGDLLWSMPLGSRGPDLSSFTIQGLTFVGPDILVAGTSAGSVAVIRFSNLHSDPMAALERFLPYGRSKFTDREMAELKFLNPNDKEPLKRSGPLAISYWISK